MPYGTDVPQEHQITAVTVMLGCVNMFGLTIIVMAAWIALAQISHFLHYIRDYRIGWPV
jgi:hypothetical protein